MKTKIFIVLILVASVAMFGTGAFAYWSSTQQITGSVIKAGSLELQLGNDCRTKATLEDGTFGVSAKAWEFDNLAPGDFIENTVCMKNNGSLDMGHVYYDWSALLKDPALNLLGENLTIIEIRDNLDTQNQVGVFNSIGVYTLADLANLPLEYVYSATPPIYPYIPAHTAAYVYMKLQFKENAPDSLQNAQVTYDLTIKGVQKFIGDAYNPANP